MKVSLTVLAALGAAQQVAATGWNVNAQTYRSPANIDNKCNDRQSSGYDFEDLDVDKPVTSYGGNNFSGFTCKDSQLSKRGEGSSSSKCVSGTVSNKHGPSFGGYEQGNSVSGMHISSDEDTEVEAHYKMPSGDTCKQTVKCSKSGTQVKNNQCGGAVQVSFKQPDTATKSCGLNIHHISFDCKPKSTTVPHSSYNIPPTSAQTTAQTTALSTTASIATSTSIAPTTTPSLTTTPALSSYSQPGTSTSPEAVPTTTPAVPSPPTPVIYYPSSNSTTTPAATTGTPSAYQTSTPSSVAEVSSSLVSNTTSTAATTPALTTTSCATTTPSSTPLATTSATPATPAECPDIVQSCLNTWMWESGCSNNAQSDCYCRNEQFISHVHECIGSWGTDCSAKSRASSYLVGICSKHIKDTPALITAVPSCACLGATTSTSSTSTPSPAMQYANGTTTPPATTPAAATPTTSAAVTTDCPVTVIPYSSVLTATTDSTTNVITIITTITIPQVAFSTVPASTSGAAPSVDLYASTTPAATPGTTTTPAATTAPSLPTATGIRTSTQPATTTSSGVLQATGAASGRTGVSFAGAAAAAGAGVLALLL